VDRIAVISDIHGNMPALETVLADTERRGVGAVYCLGDLVGKGPEGAVAVDRCREACEVIVRGNWDDGVATSDVPASAMRRWHQGQLGAARLRYLAALPNSFDFTMSGRRVRLFHASPESVYKRVHEDASPEEQRAMFVNTPFTGYGAGEPDVVGYGDIHVSYVMTLGRKTLFNAGSVGNPLDEPQAAYALLEGVLGSCEPAPFALHIVRLPYDIERAIAIAAAMGMPQLEPYAKELRTALYRSLHK
jgi:protein phosphatase